MLEKREDDERWVKQFTKVLTGTIPKIGKKVRRASRRQRLHVIKTERLDRVYRATPRRPGKVRNDLRQLRGLRLPIEKK